MEREQICFDKLGFELLIDSLKETFGSAGESMIFQMSRNYGRYLIKSVSEMYQGDNHDGFAANISQHMGRVSKLGWGSFSYDKMDWVNGEFTVNVEDNIFREDCKSGRASICYFIKGVMAGTMEEVTGQNLSIRETECYKDGDSNCIFELKRT